jgi:hypothetical protein
VRTTLREGIIEGREGSAARGASELSAGLFVVVDGQVERERHEQEGGLYAMNREGRQRGRQGLPQGDRGPILLAMIDWGERNDSLGR